MDRYGRDFVFFIIEGGLRTGRYLEQKAEGSG